MESPFGTRRSRALLFAVAAIAVASSSSARAQTTAPIPGYSHVDGLVGAKVTDGTRTAHVTGTSMDVNCTAGCSGSAGAASLSTNYMWSVGGLAWVRMVGDETLGQKVNVTTLPSLPAGSASIGQVTSNAGTNTSTANLDVALSTRTKPSDQQHTIIDSGTAAITAASLPLPSNASQETGGNLATMANTVRSPGTIPAPNSVQFVYVVNPSPPLNPFLQRCNKVRTTNCQP